MYGASERASQDAKASTAAELDALVQSQLEHALDGERRGLKVYECLRNLTEIIGTQYGDRVLYELIQNAHDAHPPGGHGKIAIRLIVEGPDKGTLYIANDGIGFRCKDVEAIRNIGTSGKEVGEGIGNKGLGFRSIELLTDDPRIYSQPTARKSERFDGYCFRFGDVAAIEALLASFGGEAAIRHKVANTIPRYLVTLPLDYQPSDVVAYAQRGYATVVVVPLRTPEAVRLATEQTRAFADLDVPLLLFLDRIGEVRIDIDLPDQKPFRRVRRRRQERLCQVTGLAGCELYQVHVGDHHEFLLVRREVEKAVVLDAVRNSLSRAPQLKRWLDWKGEPVVSIAVSLNKDGIAAGRLYNFLPMSERATAPLMGYLDAPFFTDIDRRMATLDLPLNETLMKAAAEACAAAALSIVERGLPMPPHAVFDLIAWTGDHAGKLDDAFEHMGTSLEEATVIPAIAVEGRVGWSSLSEIKLWPSGKYSVLKPRDVVRRIGARLVLPDLGRHRIERLKELAERVCENLVPSAQHLAQRAEQFAATLIERRASPRTWSQYYNDLRTLFQAAAAALPVLAGKKILLDRSGKLRPAGTRGSDGQSKVFVRMEATRRKRSSGGVPLPPRALSRRFRFLDERIAPSEETIDAFVKAGLLRIYNPVDALAGLKGALGWKANENRRREALVWAFQVWRVAGAEIEEVLRKAGLHVPTQSGWQPAERAAFSASWTRLGSVLENYLVEAGEVSVDCQQARGRLLVLFSDWPTTSQGGKRQWIRFLEAIGIIDGLRPIPSQITRKGTPADYWNYFLQSGKFSEGFDEDWCAEAEPIDFNYPYTVREIRGEAWRMPGQIEHGQLSDTAKEALCSLIFEHLKARGENNLHFKVGRFERAPRDWDDRTLPTPLAVFLRSKPWIAASAREGVVFRRPSECWSARTRARGEGPPRFLHRLPDALAVDLAENTELADLVFREAVGLRDWQSQATAFERLRDLASVAGDLAANERPVFRREYQRAWSDAVVTQAVLPEDFAIAVVRRGELAVLKGDPSVPPTVIVTRDSRSFEARVLSAAGRAVLGVGEASAEDVVALLEASKGFVPRRLDGIGVQLLVDGKPFAPSTTDPLLKTFGLEWLSDVVVIAHELLAEQLERGIARSTLENRTRAIRVQECEGISLVVDDKEISSDDDTLFYAFEHDKLPTLILTSAVTLSWKTFGRILSKPISRLIDSRLRSLETVLLRLAYDRGTDDLDAPSEEALARAIDCDVQTVKEHLLALRTDTERVLYLLVPIVAYYGGVEVARRLRADADRLGPKLDAKVWLTDNLGPRAKSPDELLNACEQAGDRAEVRRLLDLDYKTFNQALSDLGEPTLSNEPELRRLYEAYLRELKPEIIDRLRRHHVEVFRQGGDLSVYVEQKELKFLPIEEGWTFTRETLEPEVVKRHVSQLLQKTLGDDSEEKLPPLNRVLDANRKAVQQFAVEAMLLVHAWCRKHEADIPAPWDAEGPQALVHLLENKGLLDFETLRGQDIPRLCRRAGGWPENMEETLDRGALALDEDEVREEKRRVEKERKRAEIARRTIQFAGTPLDTGDANFPQNLKKIADSFLSSGDGWYERSSNRVRLATFPEVGGKPGGGGGGGKRKQRPKSERQLTEAKRKAMGLASEWLAYRYLRRRHPGYVDEDSWVSENRRQFFGGSEGNDAAGYDLRVETPQAEWLYEVKSTLEDTGEFELTANEIRVASGASKDRSRRYRILYVPHVFSPEKWCVLELPNPMGEKTRNRFKTIRRGSLRLKIERL